MEEGKRCIERGRKMERQGGQESREKKYKGERK